MFDFTLVIAWSYGLTVILIFTVSPIIPVAEKKTPFFKNLKKKSFFLQIDRHKVRQLITRDTLDIKTTTRKLEHVIVKHYAPSYMPDPTRSMKGN